MTRVYLVVEGPTEESFVSNVLAPALWPGQVYAKAIMKDCCSATPRHSPLALHNHTWRVRFKQSEMGLLRRKISMTTP